MRIALALLSVLAIPSIPTAQDACVALLRHGIYNTYRESQSASSVSTLSSQLCASYSAYKAGKLEADAQVRYGLFSGGGSYSREEVEAIGQAMCSSAYSNDEAAKARDRFSSIVSPEGLHAFDECVKAARNGLQIDVSYDETAPEIVTIAASFSPPPPGGTEAVRIQSVQVTDASGASAALKTTCTGDLYKAALKRDRLGRQVASMTCVRPVVNEIKNAFQLVGRPALAYPASVNVSTEAGTIRFLYAPVYAPPPPPPQPVAFAGEIRALAFAATDPAFAVMAKAGWLECDGRTLAAAEYPELFAALGNTFGTTALGTTFKLPDLRGQFLRGWSHGSGGDPEAAQRGPADPKNAHAGWTGNAGDSVGSRQGDGLQSHAHSVQGWHLEASGGRGFDGTGLDTNSNRDGGWTKSVSTSAAGAAGETRPRNVAVMFVIFAGRRGAP